MENIFEEIIAIDNKAKEVFDEAVREKERMEEDFLIEINKRESEIQLKADEKISKLVLQSKKELEERMNGINRYIEQNLALLDSKAQANAQTWEDTLFAKVIGE